MPIQRIFVIDAGNTRVKWGVRDGDRWDRRGAVPTPQVDAFAAEAKPEAAVDAVIASNVAGRAVQAALEALARDLGHPLQTIASKGHELGVTNGYHEPRQLGTDRWAALLAAHHAAPGDKLVVNAGTALTIDTLTADGQFLGGVIVPGPAMMRRSLDRGTAGLRLTEGRFDEFPRSTPDAITTGAIAAASGAVMRMAQAMSSRGCPPRELVLSGGAAQEIAPYLPIVPTIHENLVLDGLVLIARAS